MKFYREEQEMESRAKLRYGPDAEDLEDFRVLTGVHSKRGAI